MRDSRSNASRQRIDQMRRNRTDAGQYRGESSSHSRRAAAIHKGAHNPSTQTTQSRAAQRRGKGTHTVEHRQSLTADRLDEAIVAYKKSLAICRRLAGGGDNHLSCAWILQNIGRALHAKGELDESIKIQRQSLDIFDKVLDSSSSSSSASKNEHRIRSQSMLQQSTELKQYRDQEISRII